MQSGRQRRPKQNGLSQMRQPVFLCFLSKVLFRYGGVGKDEDVPVLDAIQGGKGGAIALSCQHPGVAALGAHAVDTVKCLVIQIPRHGKAGAQKGRAQGGGSGFDGKEEA